MINLNVDIGKRLRELRKAKHMTQGVLAEKLGCSVKHVSHAERGVGSLSLDLLIDACEVLDCTLDYLVRGEQAPPVSRIPPFVLKILCDEDGRKAREKEILLSYLQTFCDAALYYSDRKEDV